MTTQELKEQITRLWADLRENDAMVVDFPARKVGMPWPMPFEGVCFPVEIDGEFTMVSIPTDQVTRFALALTETIPKSERLDSACMAEIAVHNAISKAKGEAWQ